MFVHRVGQWPHTDIFGLLVFASQIQNVGCSMWASCFLSVFQSEALNMHGKTCVCYPYSVLFCPKIHPSWNFSHSSLQWEASWKQAELHLTFQPLTDFPWLFCYSKHFWGFFIVLHKPASLLEKFQKHSTSTWIMGSHQ